MSSRASDEDVGEDRRYGQTDMWPAPPERDPRDVAEDQYLAARSDLDPDQLHAVELPFGSISGISANAGGGKTRAIITRLVRYAADGNNPASAAALSFTRVAAEEIKQRYAQMTGDDPSRPSRRSRPVVSTCAGFGMRLMGAQFGISRTPLSESENRRLLRDLPTFQATDPDFDEVLGAMQTLCSRAELHLLVWPEFDSAGALIKVHDVSAAAAGRGANLRGRSEFRQQYTQACWFSASAAEARILGQEMPASQDLRANALTRYAGMAGIDENDFVRLLIEHQTAKHVSSAVDFSDMLYYPFLLMLQHPHLLERVRRQYRLFLADEAQDMSALDYALLTLSAGLPEAGVWPVTRGLMLVGDSKQSLYGWREGMPLVLDSLDRYLGCEDVTFGRLRYNYRSVEGIVKVTGSYAETFERRHLYASIPVRPDRPDPIEIHRFPTTSQEDKALVARLRGLHESGVSWSDCTVLCRHNRDLDQVEAAMIAARVPFHKRSSRRLTATVAFGFVNSILGIAINPRHVLAAATLALGLYGVGPKSVSRLQQSLLLKIQDDPDGTVESLLPWLREKTAASLAGLLTTLMPSLQGCSDGRPLLEGLEQLRLALQFLCSWGDAEAVGPGIRMTLPWAQIERILDLVLGVAEVLLQDPEFQDLSPRQQLNEVVSSLSLAETPADETGPREGVLLTTVHGYKGGENDYIFGVHLTRRMRVSQRDLDGERSVFYVLATRARELLYLSSAEKIRDGHRWRLGVFNVNLSDFATRHSTWQRLKIISPAPPQPASPPISLVRGRI